MPRGFSGRHAQLYLGQVSDAHTRAVSASSQVAADAPSNTNLRTRQLPFGPDDAVRSGMIATGRGNSSNIVASQHEYEAISRTISQAEDKLGECVYSVANEIEALCKTAFVMPSTVPRCLNISESVKRSLGLFRAVTEDALIQVRNFAREITNIG